jgi:apolipoprotein N-acyltransferase
MSQTTVSLPRRDRPQARADRQKIHGAPSWTRSAACLAAAGVLLLFANGRFALPLAAWLAPLLLVRFLRTSRPLAGLLAGDAVFTGAALVIWQGVAPLGGWLYVAVIALLAQGLFSIYVVDRLVAPRLTGLKATLVLPSAWAALELAAIHVSPYGSWGGMAYTQFGNLALWQVLAITGTPGVAFLIGWLASVANYAWQEGLSEVRVRAALGGCAAVLTLVLLAGQARLTLFPPEAATVRVASITASDELLKQAAAIRASNREQLAEEKWTALRKACGPLHGHLFEQTRREAAAGARIVFWPEAHATVAAEDVERLIDQGRQVARQADIYLGMGLSVQHRRDPPPNFENRFVFVGPDGGVLFNYAKQLPVPGWEAESSIIEPHDYRLPVVPTRHGLVAGAICFDMHFPWFVRQAGEQGADLILSPSNDWEAVDPWPTYVTAARAVELGASVIRHTSDGRSMAVDYQGRVLSSMDHFTTPDGQRVMVSHVPVRGVVTPYARVGDLFSWICVALLATLAAIACRR